jgi:hypothetical protein
LLGIEGRNFALYRDALVLETAGALAQADGSVEGDPLVLNRKGAEAISWGEDLESTFGVALYFASAMTGMAFSADGDAAMVEGIGLGGKRKMGM